MGLRIHRTVRVLPGVHLNLSKSGAGVTIGPRGFHLSFGPRGGQFTVGIPGTGVSYTARIGKPPPHPHAHRDSKHEPDEE